MLNQCSQRTRRRSFSCVVDLCMRLLDSSGCGAPSLMEFKLPASNTTVCGLQIGAVKTVCIQHSLISHVLYSRSWIVGLLIAYTAAMYILYTVAPLLYRMASSAYYNLSLLSSDFYGLLFGLFLFVRSSRTRCFFYNLTDVSLPALQALLALLPCICRCPGRPCHLLLVCNT